MHDFPIKSERADFYKAISLLPGILLVVGLGRLYAFYDMFGVPIFQFISFSEVISLIMGDLIWLLAIVLVAGADSYSEFLLMILFNRHNKAIPDVEPSSPEPYPNRILVWIWVIVLVGSGLAYFFVPGQFERALALRFALILALGLFAYLFLMERVSSNSRFTIQNYKYLVLITLVLMTLMLKSSYLACSMRFNKRYHPTAMLTVFKNGDTLRNSDSVFIVGRVENYSFIFDKKRQETVVINNGDVKSVVFK